MTITKKTTHVAEAQGNIVEQFKGKTNLETLIGIYVAQLQEIENALDQIRTETDDIEVAVGQQLDNIGEIVGEERGGRSDAQYRTALKVRIAINVSSGTVEDLLGVVSLLQPDLSLELVQSQPAAFVISVLDPIDPDVVDIDQIGTIVGDAKAGGVRGLIEFVTTGGKQFDLVGLGFDGPGFGVTVES